MTTIKEYAEAQNISYDKARYALEADVKKGNLVKVKDGKKVSYQPKKIKLVTVTKTSLLISALKGRFTRSELMEKTGYDSKNLSVAISMLKRKMNIVKDGETFSLWGENNAAS
jgi:hypothetical protein